MKKAVNENILEYFKTATLFNEAQHVSYQPDYSRRVNRKHDRPWRTKRCSILRSGVAPPPEQENDTNGETL